jgi:non-ribosomal peptide synthetase component E (peptide arylation enzyme)
VADFVMDGETLALQPTRIAMIMESQGINDEALAKHIDEAAWRVAKRILDPMQEVIMQEAGPDTSTQLVVNLFALICIEANAAAAGAMLDMAIPCQCDGCKLERGERVSDGAGQPTRH